jgi:hypothetical protein
MVFAIAYFAEALEINSKTVIVLGKDTISSEIYAAKELQNYLQKITGKTLPIISQLPEFGGKIIVGSGKIARAVAPNIRFNKFKADEIILFSPDNDTLLVAGARPRGALYAVYELLEKVFKVRFLSPDHEIIPKESDPVINKLNYRYAPQFVYREAHSELLRKNTIWPVKLRLNGCRYRKKIPEKWGGFYQMGLDHSLGRKYVKSNKWFKSKPQWFAFRKKQNARVPKQLCLSNPEVVAQLVKEVMAEQEKMPERRFVGIGAEDNAQYCQCEKCIKAYERYGTTGATIWLASNVLARELRKKYPETQVIYMAYWTTERPPENLKIEPNIGVVLAMLDRNHGLPPSASPRHDVYLKKFNELTNNKVYIWDYYANFRNFLLPTPQLNVIGPALQTYKRNHVKGVFAQLPFGTLAEFLDFRNYLFAKLAWNPDADWQQLMREYFNAHYGKAAPSLLAYVKLLNDARDRQKGAWIGCYLSTTAHWLKVEDILKANALFKKALTLTAQSPAVHKRVRALDASIILVNIKRYKEVAEASSKAGVPLKSREALIDKLEALGKEFKCSSYREWDSFGNLIKKLRKKDTAEIVKSESKPEKHIIKANKMKGKYTKVVDGIAISPSQQIKTAFSWMDLKYGIYYVVEPELAGRWNVTVTLRSTPAAGTSPAAAYVGIYAPHEICRQSIWATQGDTDWQKINLGKFYLPKGSKIWVAPGVIKYSPAIEVKSIELSR